MTPKEISVAMRGLASKIGDGNISGIDAAELRHMADAMEQEAAIELAYGLLWRAPTDLDTLAGRLMHDARKTLLAQLDRAGQARGIAAAAARLYAERARAAAESRKNPRTAPVRGPNPYQQ